MGRDVEWRHTDIGSGETRRYVAMRQRTRNGHAFKSCGRLPDATEHRAIADEHRFHISAALRTQLAYGFDEMYRAMPRAKCADEDRNRVSLMARERNPSMSSGMEPIGVSAP